VQDVTKDQRFDRAVDDAIGFTTRSMMAAPIRREGAVVGVLALVNIQGDEDIAPTDLIVLGRFADLVALILAGDREWKGALALVVESLRERARSTGDREPAAVAESLLRRLSVYQRDPAYRRSLRIASLVRAIARHGEDAATLAEDLLARTLSHFQLQGRRSGRTRGGRGSA
jgi:hypothetical protein